jgi:RimJ/RimL family protein N-acetyltransferase
MASAKPRQASPAFTEMLIRTEVPSCFLRPWQVEDLPALIHHANNRNVWRNLPDGFPHPYTESDAQHWLSIANNASPGIHFAIEFEGGAIGSIGVRATEDHSSLTGLFGYWLGEGHWGKGIATAAVRAMVNQIFSQTNFNKWLSPVFDWNQASMRVLEKAGFHRENHLQWSELKNGQPHHCVLYSLARDV